MGPGWGPLISPTLCSSAYSPGSMPGPRRKEEVSLCAVTVSGTDGSPLLPGCSDAEQPALSAERRGGGGIWGQ